MKTYRIRIISLIFILTAAFTVGAQTRPAADTVQTLQLASKLMGRDLPYRIVLPKDYKTRAGERYPVIYLLHGLSGHYDNWTDKTKLAEYAAGHNFIIVTPEGGDGWYTDSATVSNDKYESYIIQELIPEIDKKFRTVADRDHRIIAGLSMGGYGAIKLGLKYPELFSLAGSFSGAIGVATVTEQQLGSGNPTLKKTIFSVFGNEGSQTRKDNDNFGMVRDLTPEKLKTLPFIYQSCGTEDFLFQYNRDFDALMIEKKVPHEYREHPGIHDWKFWDEQVREFLDVAERRSKK